MSLKHSEKRDRRGRGLEEPQVTSPRPPGPPRCILQHFAVKLIAGVVLFHIRQPCYLRGKMHLMLLAPANPTIYDGKYIYSLHRFFPIP